jgi:hypothetical protein
MPKAAGLIRIYGGGKDPQRVYTRLQIDKMLVNLMSLIETKLKALIPDQSGKKWIVEHNMFPAVDWGDDGSQWTIGPIIVETDPQASKDFIGSTWVVDQNLFPLVEEREGGDHWVVEDNVEFPWQTAL